MTKTLLVAVLVLTVLAPVRESASAHTPQRTRDHVRLGGVDVRLRPGTTQVVTTKHTRGYRARVTLWERTERGWDARFRAADGRTGYGGLVRGTRRHQGTGTTPLGSYRLLWAFGTHRADPSWHLGYRRIRRGDYWVEDNGSRFYNRYRNKARGGFRWRLPASDANSSERLRDYPVQYEWSIVTSFNRRQVRHRGAGIFLHVNGSGATAGCISAPHWFVERLMRRLDPAQKPVIAVGR